MEQEIADEEMHLSMAIGYAFYQMRVSRPILSLQVVVASLPLLLSGLLPTFVLSQEHPCALLRVSALRFKGSSHTCTTKVLERFLSKCLLLLEILHLGGMIDCNEICVSLGMTSFMFLERSSLIEEVVAPAGR